MKVLFTTNYPSPYRVDFFNLLGRYVELTVIFEENPEQQNHRAKEWFNTNYNNFNVIFFKKTNTKNIISKEIIDTIKNSKFDKIIIGSYSTPSSILAILYMQLKHIPYFIEIDGGFAKDGKGLFEKIKYKLISKADGYFSTSKVADEYLIKYGANKEKIYRYPFSSIFQKEIVEIPLELKEKVILRRELGINEEKVILCIGQFIHRKGFDLILKAMNLLDNTTGLYLVGGKCTDEYTKIINSLKNSQNIHCIDFCKKERLKKYYLAADVFILPTREDIWGLVVNEAMSNGLPVITSNKCVAGLELVKNGKNGYIFESENIDELAKKIQKTLEEDMFEMGKRSIEIINNYTIENMVKVHKEVLL